MSPLASFEDLCTYQQRKGGKRPLLQPMRSGGWLVTVPDLALVPGWNRTHATVHFVLPPAFPFVPPSHFWVEPGYFRLADGMPPRSANDGNTIPGDPVKNRQATWFGWSVQSWDPNRLGMKSYLMVIKDRLGILQ